MIKKNNTLFFSLLLLLLGTSHSAYSSFFDDACNSMNFEFRAGVDPVVFSNRQDTLAIIDNNSTDEGRLDKLYDGFKFSDTFKTPWIVAGQFNWDISDCHTSFLELNYTRANGECVTRDISLRTVDAEVTGKDTLKFGDFSMFGAYFGYRYYADMFSCASVYFGSKIGLGHYKDICVNIERTEPTDPNNTFNITNTAYEKQTVVSGGLQVGMDYGFSDCASFLVQVDFLGSGALCNTTNKFVLPQDNDQLADNSNILFGKTGTLVSFPVTFGFSYNW